MKITFCMHQIITGGIEKSLVSLLEYCSFDGNVNFAVIVEKPITEQIFSDFFAERGIKVQLLENKRIEFDKKKTGCLLKFVYKIVNKFYKKRRKAELKKYLATSDLVIDYFNCSFCDLLKDIKIPKIGWYHSGFAQYKKHLAEYNKKYSKTYDKLVVITKSFQSELCHDRYIGNKIVQIYNPFDIEEIQAKATQAADKPIDGESFFTFVGRFHKDKDHQTIIDAFEIIAAQYPKVKIYFIGEGETRPYYESIVKTKKLEKNIIFLGKLDNPFGYIKYAMANILSSPSEGLSNVLVEGAILGTLNISSDCPSGPAEILLDGSAGLLYPVGDSKKLAQIMKDVLEDKVYKNELIENANKAIDRFDGKNIVRQFSSLCYNVVKHLPTYYIVSGGFDPIHEGHIEMIKASAQASDGVIVLANSDEWLCRKKGKNFHSLKTRKSILENLKGVIDVLEFDDSDNSANDGIKKARAKYPTARLVFANGGDRGKDNIPEGPVCAECGVDLAFGVGGDNKANSSSWILNKWNEEN